MNTPKFKEGDWIKSKKDGRIARVVMLLATCYDLSPTDGDCWLLDYDSQDRWELTDAPPKNKLEEAARLYSDNQDASDYPDVFSRKDIKSAFIAGAEWMAKHK